MDRALTPLQTRLLALASCKNSLEAALRTFKRHHRNEESCWVLSNHLLILVCSFKAEWQRFAGLGGDLTVRETLRIAQPAIDRIDKWPGIRSARNSVLAHATHMSGELPDVWQIAGSGTVPLAYAEIALLGECAVYAAGAALIRHESERAAGVEKFTSQRPEIKDCGIRTNKEFDEEVLKIRRAMIAADPLLEAAFGEFRAFGT